MHLRPCDLLAAQPPDEGPAVDRIEADAEDLEAVGGVLTVQPLERGQFGQARRAPGRPEVHEDDLPVQRPGRPAAPLEVADVEPGDHRGQVAPVEGGGLRRGLRRQGRPGKDAGRQGRDRTGAQRHQKPTVSPAPTLRGKRGP